MPKSGSKKRSGSVGSEKKGEEKKKKYDGFFGTAHDWQESYTEEDKDAFLGDFRKYEEYLQGYLPANPKYGPAIKLDAMYLLEKTGEPALIHIWGGPRWLNAVVYSTEAFVELQEGVTAEEQNLNWFNDGNSKNFYQFGVNVKNKVQVQGETMEITKQFKPGMFKMAITPVNIELVS